jgi:hypothetical protein
MECVVAPRAYWKGYLKLSLVSCPVALFPASSERENHSRGTIRDRFAEQIWREPTIPAVLCGSNDLSGGGVGISRIGIRRIDFLGPEMKW